MGKAFLRAVAVMLALAALVCPPGEAAAKVDGVKATAFTLTAKEGRVQTGDGNSIYAWGYANGSGPMQYPGVTMIVDEGDLVTVSLTNQLPTPVSIVFPGQVVTAAGGSQGLMTREAASGQTVTYTFTASSPGTYLYHSGTRPELQVEMGLSGALIVRPAGYDASSPRAYGHADAAYDREYLFLLTEMDSRIHDLVEYGGTAALDGYDYLTNYFPNYWFINGRTAPDTMMPSYVGWLPNQPYGAMAMMHPGDRLLMRIVAAGRDLHPYHMHGNHARVIARDGRLLSSSTGAGPDLGIELFTIKAVPGQTVDAVFEWTGKGLGWDIYGAGEGYEHACVDADSDLYDDTTSEYCPDHGKPLPVALPDLSELTFGGFYSGSPYLGHLGSLPPGEGGLNPNGGFVYMWHSHTEKELTNFDMFPGGMMTMLIIEPPGAHIHE